jgi:hypothetical protein
MNKKILFQCLFGSRLYGTQVPDSDFDYKIVFMTDMDDYLYSRGKLDTANTTVYDPQGVKTEVESFHIQEFARLLSQNQTIAMTLLFAPQSAWVISSPAWEELLANKDKVISKHIQPYIGYARGQAVKYSLKGDRLGTLEAFISHVKRLNITFRGGVPSTEAFEDLCRKFEGREGIRLWTDTVGDVTIRLIEVCGKSFGETTPLKLWEPPLEALWNKFGQRSRDALESNGRDLKAMYHAVRIVSEASELLNHGTITYPRPEVDLLMKIRRGEMTNGEVQDLLEDLIVKMNQDFEACKLPESPDNEWLRWWAIRSMKQEWSI